MATKHLLSSDHSEYEMHQTDFIYENFTTLAHLILPITFIGIPNLMRILYNTSLLT